MLEKQAIPDRKYSPGESEPHERPRNVWNRIPEFKHDQEPVTQIETETDSGIPGHEAFRLIRRTEWTSEPHVQLVHSLRSRTVWIQADDLDNSVSC